MALKRRVESKSQPSLAARVLAQRELGRAEVSLERLEAEFGEASRYEIVASLKELEKAGSGQFVVGSKGQRSRFIWSREKEPDARRAAKKARKASKRRPVQAAPSAADAGPPLSGRASADAPARPRAPRPAATHLRRPEPRAPALETLPGALSRSLRHTFHLRPGLLVSIELPEDVTATEVARFCSFLQAIPFAGDTRR